MAVNNIKLVLVFIFFSSTIITVNAGQNKVSEQDGAEYTSEGYFNSNRKEDARFFVPLIKNAVNPFWGYQGIGKIGGSFGFFAVNPWTGDVWDLWSCKQLQSAALDASKAKIRQSFTSDVMYQKYSSKKPECFNQ